MKLNPCKIRFVCICFIVFISHSSAQSVLKITEETIKGRIYNIKSIIKKNDKDSSYYTYYPSVDINSLIHIELDKEKIKQIALNSLVADYNLPFDKMQEVSLILSKRLELINAIQFDSPDLEERKSVLKDFSARANSLLIIIYNLGQENPLKIKVTKVFSTPNLSAKERYNKVFDLLQEEINSIEAAYKNSLEQNKVFFRIGTFINNTPVHLEGFDSYKEGDYHFVPPFITTIPENQVQKFQKEQELALQANKNAIKAFSNKFQEVLNSSVEMMRIKLKDSINNPLKSLINLISQLKNIPNEIVASVNLPIEETSGFLNSVDLLMTNLKKMDQSDYLKTLTESIAELRSDYINLKKSVDDLITNQQTNTIPELKLAIDNFKKGLESGQKVIDNDLIDFKNFIETSLLTEIGITKKIDESLLKLADEVSKLPLDNIPNQTMLDLKKTVVRKNGDRLFFKAVLTKASSEKEKQEEKTIDYTSIGLYQIGLHNSIQATMILVHNLSGKFKSEKQFQFAPSYSVLFKNGSRKSSFYNDFLDFGLGVNVATLDFNKDDNPEVGLGLVVSSFKDYLQLGCGRNFGVDQNYWFFGIRLPLLGFNIDRKLDISTDNP
jgi:hypothetical protein